MDTPFRIALGILIAALLAVRIPRHIASFRPARRQKLEGGANLALRIGAALLGAMLMFTWLFRPESLAWAAVPIPALIRWLGAPIGAAGIIGLILVHRELGRNFSGNLEIRADHALVTTGPYRKVRHPMYTAIFLVLLAFCLLSANAFLGAIWLGSFSAIIAWRLPHEEAAMQARFGDSYRTWAARTGRLLPRL